MNNIDTVILLIFVTLTIVLLSLNMPEHFLGIINKIHPTEIVTKDLSKIERVETLDSDFNYKLNNIIDQLLSELNNQYNKSLIRINVERAEKTVINEKLDNYKVFVFVLNSAKESTAKLLLDFDVQNDSKVSVKQVAVLGSRQSIFKNKQGESARDTKQFKSQVDMDKVIGSLNGSLPHSLVNYKETTNKMIDRNSWILPKERIALGNRETFPGKVVHPEWDSFGVEYTDDNSKIGGLNHGTRKFSFLPNFYKSNYQICIGDYLWLFGTAEDVISQPIGVG